mmetsp:Transcript_33878/g.93586  ORF Transcript_33878/g.93586 Transcript_33878/m.93586 type:complete len:208 (-) Transcript_33878:121-744(-)
MLQLGAFKSIDALSLLIGRTQILLGHNRAMIAEVAPGLRAAILPFEIWVCIRLAMRAAKWTSLPQVDARHKFFLWRQFGEWLAQHCERHVTGVCEARGRWHTVHGASHELTRSGASVQHSAHLSRWRWNMVQIRLVNFAAVHLDWPRLPGPRNMVGVDTGGPRSVGSSPCCTGCGATPRGRRSTSASGRAALNDAAWRNTRRCPGRR